MLPSMLSGMGAGMPLAAPQGYAGVQALPPRGMAGMDHGDAGATCRSRRDGAGAA